MTFLLQINYGYRKWPLKIKNGLFVHLIGVIIMKL